MSGVQTIPVESIGLLWCSVVGILYVTVVTLILRRQTWRRCRNELDIDSVIQEGEESMITEYGRAELA